MEFFFFARSCKKNWKPTLINFFFFWLEVAKKRKPTSMDLFIYLFLLEVAKKWETNVKGLTTVKKQKNVDANFLIEDT